MKVLKIAEPRKAVLSEGNKPETGPGEVLVKLRYVGLCGSDLSTYLGKNPMVQYPRVPGHEISGRIDALGESVPGGFSLKEPVTVVPYTNCGQCPSCRRGRAYACQFNETMGVQRDGAMQEYISVPWQKILKAPELSYPELALVEPLTVGFHAVERGRITDSDTVMIMGCGMIGAGAIVRSVLRGARVIAVDIDEYKLSLARDLGAQFTLNSMRADLHEELIKLTDGDGPDVVVEAAGHPLTYRAAVEEVAFTGRIVCIGYAGSEVSLATNLFVQKEMDILGSRNATAEDFKSVIAYLDRGTFPLEKMITRKVKLFEAPAAFREWASDPGKVMKILVDLT